MDRRIRGRDPELLTISELVDATTRGEGAVLLIEGPTGIGRSRLLAEAGTMARRAGIRHASADAFEAHRTIPFATLLAALLEGERPIWDVAGLNRLHGEREFVYWLVEEIHDVLEAAALECPLMIALDDLQSADAGTLAALHTLVPRTSHLPILWAFAARSGEPRRELRELLRRLAGARHLALRPLSDDAVGVVVSDRLGAAGEPALLRLAANAHGNPFLLVDLLEGLREEGRVQIVNARAHADGDELPGRLAETMRDRLDRLSPDAGQVVRVAAVLGQRFSAEQLAAMLGQQPSQLLGPIEGALASDLLSESGDQLRFQHELLRQAVLQTLTRSVRRGLQRQAADVLLAHGAHAIQVAAQLAESAEAGDEVAIEQLRQAARCLSESDPGVAADMSVRAFELTPRDAPARGPLFAETLVLLYAVMRDAEADELAGAALRDTLSAEDEAEVRLSLSSRLMGRDLVGAEENRRALRLPGLSPRMRAQHLGWLTCTLANAGLVAEAEANVGRAFDAAAEADDPSARAMAMIGQNSIAFQRGEYGQTLGRLEELDRLAAAAGDHVAARMAEFQRADALAATGRLDESMNLLGEGLARGQRERRACVVTGWVAASARLRYLSGMLADARADAEAADSNGLALSSDVGGAAAILARFQVALHTGDRAQMRASVRTARRLMLEGSPAVRRHATWILALAAADAGDVDEAARRLSDDELPDAVPFLPGDPALHPQVARIALAAGDQELARRALTAAEEIERANPGIELLRGLAAHARGLVEHDASELLRATELLRGSQRPIALASALEDAGRMLRDVEHLGAALELYSSAGATGDAARVTRRLRACGVRARLPQSRPAEGWESLTESELRVIRLVGHGATNRDAAERLFLSPHTVSSHLRHAFVKLRINSRVELARLVLEHEVPALAA